VGYAGWEWVLGYLISLLLALTTFLTNPSLDTSSWLAAYANDTAVLNTVSQLNQAENFAQMSVVALADHENPGCWDSVIPNLHKVSGMMRQI